MITLERFLDYVEQRNLHLPVIRVRLLWANQQMQLGHHQSARALLRRSLHDIEQTGYVRLLLDSPSLLPLLSAVDTNYARSLAARMHPLASSYVHNNLTQQEFVILGHLVKGAKIADIAEKLVISKATVKWHLTNIYAKSGVKNQREAVSMAIRVQMNAT